MALPPLTPEQRAAALEKAAVARRERAAVKNRLKYAQGLAVRGHRRRQGERRRRQDEGLGAAGVDARRRPGAGPPDHGGGRHLRDPPGPRPGRTTRSPRCSSASTRRDRRHVALRSRLVAVLAGPTAVGKGTVAAYVREHFPEVWLSVSATTRKPRPGEVDGIHYHFVDDAEFDRMVDARRAAGVGGRPRPGQVRHPARPGRGRPRGRATRRCSRSTCRAPARCASTMPEALFVFLAPPTWDELVRRLVGRGTEDEEEREARLATAQGRAGGRGRSST